MEKKERIEDAQEEAYENFDDEEEIEEIEYTDDDIETTKYVLEFDINFDSNRVKGIKSVQGKFAYPLAFQVIYKQEKGYLLGLGNIIRVNRLPSLDEAATHVTFEFFRKHQSLILEENKEAQLVLDFEDEDGYKIKGNMKIKLVRHEFYEEPTRTNKSANIQCQIFASQTRETVYTGKEVLELNYGSKYQKECAVGTCVYRCLLMDRNEEYTLVEAKSVEEKNTIFYYIPLSLGDSFVLELKEFNSSGEEFTSVYKIFFRK